MADAISRVTSGDKIGVFCMQHGPGTENAYGGVAQAYGESMPILVVPRRLSAPHRAGRRQLQRDAPDARHHQIGRADHHAGRSRQRHAPRHSRACATAAAGRCWSKCRSDLWNEEVPDPLDYTPVVATRYGPDPEAVREAAKMLAKPSARCSMPARACTGPSAWKQLRAARRASRARRSSPASRARARFPETHPLVARLRRPRGAEAGAILSSTTRT